MLVHINLDGTFNSNYLHIKQYYAKINCIIHKNLKNWRKCHITNALSMNTTIYYMKYFIIEKSDVKFNIKRFDYLKKGLVKIFHLSINNQRKKMYISYV